MSNGVIMNIKYLTEAEAHTLCNERKGLFDYKEENAKKYNGAYLGQVGGIIYLIEKKEQPVVKEIDTITR
jgi:hypothetical protein